MSRKQEITFNQLQHVIKQDKNVIEIKKKLENVSSKITLIWNLSMQASKYIESFGTETQGNIVLIEKLERENLRLHKKYKEYEDLLEDLEDDLDDTINIIVNKYNIVRLNMSDHIMTIAPSARGSHKKRNKNKKSNKSNKKIEAIKVKR